MLCTYFNLCNLLKNLRPIHMLDLKYIIDEIMEKLPVHDEWIKFISSIGHEYEVREV